MNESTALRQRACPKFMEYGPCGGVEPDGRCEAAPHPCVFLDRRLAQVSQPSADEHRVETAAGREILEISSRRPLVFTGFPVPAMDSRMIAPVAEQLLGSVDAVLSGDAGHSRTQFSPSYRAALIGRTGLRVWNGFNARDRNRVALRRELRSLREIGVAGVHCVTGDHTLLGDRADAKPVFDLESTTILPIARELGLLTSSAESPAAPPVDSRAARVRSKQAAGSMLTLLQYCGDVESVAAFVDACSSVGVTSGILPGVPLAVDVRGAELLDSFQASALPTGMMRRIAGADDPYRTGIDMAIEYGRHLLALGSVAGVVIAGAATPGRELAFARAQAIVARELGGGSQP